MKQKHTISLDKTLELVDKARHTTISVFSEAEKYNFTHDSILDNLQYRLAKIRQNHLPRWAEACIHEMATILFQNLYSYPNPKVVWRHVVDGKQYAKWEDMPEHGKELGRQNKLVSGHFWAHSGMPYSTPETDATRNKKIADELAKRNVNLKINDNVEFVDAEMNIVKGKITNFTLTFERFVAWIKPEAGNSVDVPVEAVTKI